MVIADTDGGGTDGEPVRYQVLCRQHHRVGDLGPSEPSPGQLTLM